MTSRAGDSATLDQPGRRCFSELLGGLPAEVRRTPWPTVLVIFALSLVARVICFTGLVGSDDIFYSIYAQQIVEGVYQLERQHMAIRYGVILPVAVIYKVFGMHEWSTVVLPLAASALAPALVAILGFKLSGATAAWVAGLLLASFPVDVRCATILVPESMLQAAVLVGAIVYVAAWARSSVILGLISGIVLGSAYLIKEPAAFIVVALAVFAFVQRRWWLGLAVAAGAAMVLAAELTWYWMEMRDLLFRAHAMIVHDRQPEVLAANEQLFYRLVFAYPKLMLIPNESYGLHSLLAATACIIAGVSERSKRTVLLLLWAAVPFLYLNFGSSSLERYWALPVAPRYVSLIYPPLFLLAGIVVAESERARGQKVVAFITLTLVCSVGIACAVATRRSGYRIEEVRNLRLIAGAAQGSGQQVCEITGARSKRWRQTLRILAPDVLGCSGGDLLTVTPNASGLPVSRALATFR